MNNQTDFRICPETGLKIHRPAEALIKANAVAAVVFLLIGGVLGLRRRPDALAGSAPAARPTRSTRS